MVEERNELTATEGRIYDLLRNGRPRHVTELLTCLADELSNEKNLARHVSTMRSKLSARGLGIYVTQKRSEGIMYRLVRFVSSE